VFQNFLSFTRRKVRLQILCSKSEKRPLGFFSTLSMSLGKYKPSFLSLPPSSLPPSLSLSLSPFLSLSLTSVNDVHICVTNRSRKEGRIGHNGISLFFLSLLQYFWMTFFSLFVSIALPSIYFIPSPRYESLERMAVFSLTKTGNNPIKKVSNQKRQN